MADKRRAFLRKLVRAGWSAEGSGYRHPDGGEFYLDKYTLDFGVEWVWWDDREVMPPTSPVSLEILNWVRIQADKRAAYAILDWLQGSDLVGGGRKMAITLNEYNKSNEIERNQRLISKASQTAIIGLETMCAYPSDEILVKHGALLVENRLKEVKRLLALNDALAESTDQEG